MALADSWAGTIYGTNTGRLYAQLTVSNETSVTGELRVNDDHWGISIYEVSGSLDGVILTLTGIPKASPPDVEIGKMSARGRMEHDGKFIGEWENEIGTKGQFDLYPHHSAKDAIVGPDRLFTERHEFGPIEIDREQLVELAEKLTSTFSSIVVTTSGLGSESYLFDTFNAESAHRDDLHTIQILAQMPERGNLMRRVLIEFGPVTNYVQVESADQSWAVGQKEILKKRISKLEKTYIIGIRRLGIGINQVLLLGMLIFLPGLESDQDRAILVAGVVSVIWSIWWIHQKFLGNAIIRLSPQPAPVYLKLGTQLISWSIGLVGTMISSLILAYLKGWLGLP